MSTTPYFRTLAGIGNLGVGTTSPTANLQVVGNVYASNALTATNVLATTMNTGTMNVTSIAVSGSTATTGYVLSSTSSGTGLAWVAQSGGLSGLGTNGILYATSATTAATVPTYVYSGGNVGIGTAGPTANLHVYGTSTSNIQMIVNNISTSGGTNHSAYIHSDQSYCGGTSGIGSFTYSAATLLVTSYPNNTANNSGYTVYFGTSAADLTSLSPQMVVKSATGYVGIGVASPTTALQVSGTVTATAFAGSGTSLTSIPMGQASGTLAIANGGTGASSTSQNYVFAGPTSGSGAPSFRGLASGDIPNNAANTSGSAGSLSTTYGTGQILYGQASGVPASTSTFVYSGGSVGIGTATPGAQLTLTSNVYAGGYIQSAGTAGGIQSQGAYMGWNLTGGVGETDFINQQGLGSGGWRWYNYNNSAQLTSNAAALSAAGGLTLGTYSNVSSAPTGGLICPGNVGIGTNNPTSTLQVNGDIYMGGNYQKFFFNCGNSAGYIQGIYAADGSANSDVFISAAYNQYTATKDSGNWGPSQVQISSGNNQGGKINFRCANTTSGALSSIPIIASVTPTGLGVGATSAVTSPKLFSANDVYLNGSLYAGDFACQIAAVGASNPNKRLALMYDTSNNISLVQSMIVGTGTTPLILNAAGGNVGIGNTSPGFSLDVNGTIATRTDIRWNGTGLNAADKKLYSPADGDLEWMTNYGAGVHGFAVSHQGTKYVYLNISGNSYLNGGNVGIGTASPGSTLTVYSSNTVNDFTLASYATTLDFQSGQRLGLALPGWTTMDPNGGTTLATGVGIWDALVVGGYCIIGTSYAQSSTQTGPTNGLIVQGNVGIGTASPGYTLHTSGTACLGYGIYQNPNSDGDARHYITYQTAVAAGSVGTNADGRLNIQDRAGNYIRFFTGFPNGTVNLQGLIYQSGGSTLYAASSDYRIKSNVVPLSNSLDTINSLKPVSFTFNSHTEITEAGFLAHEVQEVVPNCVSGEKDQVAEDGSIIPQSLDKSYLVTHLVGAIQELSATVQSLKERIATLEKNTPTN